MSIQLSTEKIRGSLIFCWQYIFWKRQQAVENSRIAVWNSLDERRGRRLHGTYTAVLVKVSFTSIFRCYLLQFWSLLLDKHESRIVLYFFFFTGNPIWSKKKAPLWPKVALFLSCLCRMLHLSCSTSSINGRTPVFFNGLLLWGNSLERTRAIL